MEQCSVTETIKLRNSNILKWHRTCVLYLFVPFVKFSSCTDRFLLFLELAQVRHQMYMQIHDTGCM